MTCAVCRGRVDRERAWHRVERGVEWAGETIGRDLDFCSAACLAVRFGETG